MRSVIGTIENMKNKLTIVGSGTCNLVPEKAAASVLIEVRNTRLVYDFGRGVAIRLTEHGLKQDDIEHIFLSHFHPDHVSDLYSFLQAASWSQIDARTRDLTIYGPPGVKAFTDKMFAVFGQEELSRTFSISVVEVDDTLTIAGQTFKVVDLHHSFGLRLNGVAIAGDANVNDDLIRLLGGARVGVFDAGHISNEEICEVAVRTQATQLICSHQYRPLDEKLLNKIARNKGFTGKLIVAHDLMEFTF